MSLVINNNTMANNVARTLNTHYAQLSTSTQRLSSGLRINSAADDAAGLAIRELMRSDVSTLQQGARNANDAISLIQTADGSLGIIDEKLIRMKELAEQAATGTYDSTQRLMIESEYQAMASEITRIASATDFNGIHILDGSLDGPHSGSQLTQTGAMKIHFGTGNDSAEDYYYIDIPGTQAWNLGPGLGSGATALQQAQRAAKAAYAASMNIHNDPAIAQSDANAIVAAVNGHMTVERNNNYTPDAWNALTWYEQDSLEFAWAHIAIEHIGAGQCGFGQLNNDPAGSAQTVGRLAAAAYGDFRGNTILTQDSAQQALGAIDEAITDKDRIRAALGALQNRFENTISNLNIQAENLQNAESRVSDVDVATEMTQFVRNQILTQSAVSMLAQANSMPQMAMQLLGG